MAWCFHEFWQIIENEYKNIRMHVEKIHRATKIENKNNTEIYARNE